MAYEALRRVGYYYVVSSKYEKDFEFYKIVPVYELSGRDIAEVKFKFGYSYIVQNDFDYAKNKVYQVKQVRVSDYCISAPYDSIMVALYQKNRHQVEKTIRRTGRYMDHRMRVCLSVGAHSTTCR